MSSPKSPSNPKSSSTSPSTKPNKKDAPLRQVANLIKSGKAKNIVVLTGAGISTSAGIPDFRSPETGLYANLERLNLPFPEAVFELGYFKKNPVPFWTLAKDLYPGKYLPTPTHYFLTLLHNRSHLLRTFTQNIDTLETLAHLPPEKIIEAHGSFATAHCLSCTREISTTYVLEAGVREGKVVLCPHKKCGGLVKPDIVFFGEGLPARFFQNISDLKKADLVIIMGTSLQVHPFASLHQYCKPGVPRLLINREPVGPFRTRRTKGRADLGDMMSGLGLSDSEDDNDGEEYRYWEGDADEGVWALARMLGWEEELKGMIEKGHEGLKSRWSLEAVKRGGEAVDKVDVVEVRKVAEVTKGEKEEEIKVAEPVETKADEVDDGDTSCEEGEDDGKIPSNEISAMGRILAEHLEKGDPVTSEDPDDKA